MTLHVKEKDVNCIRSFMLSFAAHFFFVVLVFFLLTGQQRRQASQLHRQEVRDQANDYLQQLKLVREGKLKIQRPGKEEEA